MYINWKLERTLWQPYLLGSFFSKNKTPSLVIKYYSWECDIQIPKRTRLMWRPTNSRKGDDEHGWMKVNRYLLAPLDPPVMPSYWLFSVAKTSVHISCNNFICYMVWLEKNGFLFDVVLWYALTMKGIANFAATKLCEYLDFRGVAFESLPS